MNPEMDSEDAEAPQPTSIFGQWPVIALASIVLLMLTGNPLLTGILPYLKAGWPASKTALWLKRTDPWPARGTVGFLFHLCMALFCAGAWALVCVIGTAVVASITQKQPDLTQFVIAILIIAFGCCLSSLLGGIGIVIALRHRVRIFVKSNLSTVCHGDFTRATTLGPGRIRINPANYIIGVATVAPLLGTWFVAMLMTAPGARIDKVDTTQLILMWLLPVVAATCIAILIFLSARITANSPAECWGAEVPESEEEAPNWYQLRD